MRIEIHLSHDAKGNPTGEPVGLALIRKPRHSEYDPGLWSAASGIASDLQRRYLALEAAPFPDDDPAGHGRQLGRDLRGIRAAQNAALMGFVEDVARLLRLIGEPGESLHEVLSVLDGVDSERALWTARDAHAAVGVALGVAGADWGN